MTHENERDRWLSLDDDALVAQCKVDNYRASGPGGQHRNKVSSAVRLRHEPSGIVAHAEESRSQHENKKRAIRRLRLEIALNVRAKVATNLRADVATNARTDAAASLRADSEPGSRADAAARLTPSGDVDGALRDGASGEEDSMSRSSAKARRDAADSLGDAYDSRGKGEAPADNFGPYEPPAVFLQYRTKAGRIEVSTKNHDFALVVAAVLDVLSARMGSVKEAAALLGVSTSQLSRFITSEPPILRAANRIREQHGLKHLTAGN